MCCCASEVVSGTRVRRVIAALPTSSVVLSGKHRCSTASGMAFVSVTTRERFIGLDCTV